MITRVFKIGKEEGLVLPDRAAGADGIVVVDPERDCTGEEGSSIEGPAVVIVIRGGVKLVGSGPGDGREVDRTLEFSRSISEDE